MNPFIIPSIIAGVVLILLSITVVKQGHIGVVTFFGKYQRIMYPGINLKMPLLENVYKKISIQNQSIELEFQAITADQANVNFKALIVFRAVDEKEETIKNIAFKFIDQKSFMQTMVRSVESSIRSFVATKKQSEVLGLRSEIVHAVKEHLDHSLMDWGFHLLDLQLNDISFDEAIMRSMAQVVASNNLKAAAENEGMALLITKTKAAEAESVSIRMTAQAEMDATNMRGLGNAQFRKNVADGLAQAGEVMEKGKVDPAFMLFTMWLDGMKYISEHGKGNVMFFDGSNDGMDKTLKQMQAMNSLQNQNGAVAHK